MSYDATLIRGSSGFTGSSKFGLGALATGVFAPAIGASLFGGDGNTITTGTFEAWFRSTDATASNKVLFGCGQFFWVGTNAGKLTGSYGGAGATSLLTTNTVNDGLWHHVAIVFTSGVAALYLDGNRVLNPGVTQTLGPVSSPVHYLGFGGFGDNITGSSAFDYPAGYALDELRVSNIARYSGTTYTVPTLAFASDANTIALYHLESDGTDSASAISVTIAPNDAGIVYSPYTWDVSSLRALGNVGAYFRTLISGSPNTITLTFDVSNVAATPTQIAYRINRQNGWTVTNVAASVAIGIPSTTIAWPKHFLEVVVKSSTDTSDRWASPYACSAKFTGIILGGASGAVSAPTQRTLRGLAFGDSITEGVNTLSSSGDLAVRSDTTLGWAFQLGELLGAEMGVVGWGGQGIVWNGTTHGVPNANGSYNFIVASIARSFALVPDFIVANFGTNDQRQGISSSAFQAGYVTFLNNLLAATPASTLIFVEFPFGAYYGTTPYTAAIAACNNPSRVIFVDTTGWWNSSDSPDTLHPYGYINQSKLGPLTAQAIRTGLNRGNTYLNVSGTAKAVGPKRN